MSGLYKWINPPVKLLLKSPLHGLMSQNTLLLEFRGRVTGKSLSTPISYHLKNGAAHCFTSRSYRWWRNLVDGEKVFVTVKGQRFSTSPVVVSDDLGLMKAELESFLKAVPRDAPHSGVRLNDDGSPNLHDIEQVIPAMVFLKFPILEG